MTTTTLTHTIRKIMAAVLVASAITASASTEVTNLKDALDVALKNKTIAAAGEKMKLRSANANYSKTRKTWIFTFYDGGDQVHTVYVDAKGKARYSSRDKGSARIFDEIDWTKLPAPSTLLIDDIIGKAKSALTALNIPPAEGRINITYYLQQEPRQKDVAYHSWRVTLRIRDGKQSKTVGFKNGVVDTISASY